MELMLAIWFWIAIGHVRPAFGQTSELFQWEFGNKNQSETLTACSTLPIVIKPFSSNPTIKSTPPYYLRAFVLGGTPVTTLLGSTGSTFNWTIPVRGGSQVVLSVVDANGSEGGVAPPIFNVRVGASNSCIPAPPESEFTVTANVTTELSTCEPWRFTITGGTPPYILTLAAPDSPVVSNETLIQDDNIFTYINRASPGGQLLGAISDSTGRWADGTPIVRTKGISDVTCNGLDSTSSKSSTSIINVGDHPVIASSTNTTVQPTATAPPTASSSTVSGSDNGQRTATIASVVVLVVVVNLFAAAMWFFLRRRRRNIAEEDALTAPRQFIAPLTTQGLGPIGVKGGSYNDSPALDIRNNRSPDGSRVDLAGPWASGGTPANGYISEKREMQGGYSRPSGPTPPSDNASRTTRTKNPGARSFQSREPSLLSFPPSSLAPPTRTRTREQLRLQTNPSTIGTGSDYTRRSPNSASSLLTSLRAEHRSRDSPLTIEEEDGSLVVQHRDGGRVVRELPPPYGERQDGL